MSGQAVSFGGWVRIPRASGLLALLLACVSCGSAQPRAESRPSLFAARLSLTTLTSKGARPSPGACVVSSTPPHVAWAAPIPISMERGGPAVAVVFRAPAELLLQGDAGRVLLDDGWLRLAGLVRAEHTDLFPRGPARDGAIVLLPGATLRPTREVEGRIQGERRLLGPLRLPGDAPQRWELPCAALSLSRVEYDAKASASLVGRIGYGYVRGGQLLKFYRTATHAESSQLQVHLPKSDWLELELHREDSGRALVSYRQGAELIVGWLDRAALDAGPRAPAHVTYGAGRRYLMPRGKDARRCLRRLELGILFRGKAVQLGELRPGGDWEPVLPEQELGGPGLVAIRVPHAAWLELAPGAELVARGRELARCAEPG